MNIFDSKSKKPHEFSDESTGRKLLHSSDITLPELFESQVKQNPHACAVRFAEQALTYSELDSIANRLAWRLIAQEIGPEDLVALALPRGVEMVAAILGVLKAGAAYLPLDISTAPERLAFILQDLSLIHI